MARSDLLLNLVQAGSQGNQVLFRRTVEAIIAEERAKQHHVLADRLSVYLRNESNGKKTTNGSAMSIDPQLQNLLVEIIPDTRLSDLIIPESVVTSCRELVEEHHRRELLRSYNLEPRHRVLLIGPPGNGKTSLARAIAEGMMVPLLVVRYEGVVGSYLGETAARLKRVFDHARSRGCVLFFDEFDTIGKERGDAHETGEIKRVVSSLLLQIDDLPSHVVVITATNHPELLDRAVWRRFQLRLLLPMPSRSEVMEWIARFERRVSEEMGEQLFIDKEAVVDALLGLSFAEFEEFGSDIVRRRVLTMPNSDMSNIIQERLKQWKHRARTLDLKNGDRYGG